ncbi:MAG: hypothetical protein OXI96_08585 [Acidimicrobiaceae bacterium]|nr:hypothetical protein [Acidimicrobiaceae bacterium]
MASIVLVTSADWLADECRSALEGDHSLLRLRQGMDVLDAMANTKTHLVILDMQIGNMGGIATCLAIRQKEEIDELKPCAILLLLDRSADEFLAQQSGADLWLTKPIVAFHLARVVAELCPKLITTTKPTKTEQLPPKGTTTKRNNLR